MYFTDDIFVLLTGKPAIGKIREKRQFLAGMICKVHALPFSCSHKHSSHVKLH